MKKNLLLILMVFLFNTNVLYAGTNMEELANVSKQVMYKDDGVFATADEIRTYLPADLQAQVKKGEMLVPYGHDSVLLLSREDIIKYVTMKKYTNTYKDKFGKEKQVINYQVLFYKDNYIAQYYIGDTISTHENGFIKSYVKMNYFGCYLTPKTFFNEKGEEINTIKLKEFTDRCNNPKFNR